MGDFCANHIELHKRLDEMRLAYENTALLTEGTYTLHNGQIMLWRGNTLTPSLSYKTYSSFIQGLQRRHTEYYHTLSLEETIYRIILMHDHLPFAGKKATKKAKTPEEIISAIPGEGLKKATKLKKDYDTPIDALKDCDSWLSERGRATLEDW